MDGSLCWKGLRILATFWSVVFTSKTHCDWFPFAVIAPSVTGTLVVPRVVNAKLVHNFHNYGLWLIYLYFSTVFFKQRSHHITGGAAPCRTQVISSAARIAHLWIPAGDLPSIPWSPNQPLMYPLVNCYIAIHSYGLNHHFEREKYGKVTINGGCSSSQTIDLYHWTSLSRSSNLPREQPCPINGWATQLSLGLRLLHLRPWRWQLKHVSTDVSMKSMKTIPGTSSQVEDPLVMTNIAIENHHFLGENPL